MPVNLIQVKEYECIKCGYKWINRKNGKDGPTPRRCAKCKQSWKGNISRKESRLRYRLRYTIGESKVLTRPPFEGRRVWRTDPNVYKLLDYRPSIRDLQLILEPMCYLIDKRRKVNIALYDDQDRYDTLEILDLTSMEEFERMKRRWENDAIRKNLHKIRDYQLQLSKQLIEYFLEKYSAPYQPIIKQRIDAQM